MELNFDNIKRLFEALKTMSFWERLFDWGKVRRQMIDASGDLQKLISNIEGLKQETQKLENSISRITLEKEGHQKDNAALKDRNDQYLRRGTDLASDVAVLKQKIENIDVENKRLREENSKFNNSEDQRRNDYEKAIFNLNKLNDQLTRERNEEKDKRYQVEIDRLNKLKETWSNHEANVKSRIKAICSRHMVEYLDNVPFKGRPDNTLKIKDEFIIFDAKSPGGDNLSNFPNYIKNQVESAIKYVKEEDVRKEVFLVIPTNTLEHLQQFEYKLSEYTVYIISIDSLEPIILALKKIEEYEFAEQLSPEERDNICRIIGKFVHLSKRRIQIDGFFAKQFFELVYRSDADLPKEILEKVSEFEKAEKINPPIEKRAKQISTKELESDTNQLRNAANLKGIVTEDSLLSKGLNKLPLYSTDVENPASDEQAKLF